MGNSSYSIGEGSADICHRQSKHSEDRSPAELVRSLRLILINGQNLQGVLVLNDGKTLHLGHCRLDFLHV